MDGFTASLPPRHAALPGLRQGTLSNGIYTMINGTSKEGADKMFSNVPFFT